MTFDAQLRPPPGDRRTRSSVGIPTPLRQLQRAPPPILVPQRIRQQPRARPLRLRLVRPPERQQARLPKPRLVRPPERQQARPLKPQPAPPPRRQLKLPQKPRPLLARQQVPRLPLPQQLKLPRAPQRLPLRLHHLSALVAAVVTSVRLSNPVTVTPTRGWTAVRSARSCDQLLTPPFTHRRSTILDSAWSTSPVTVGPAIRGSLSTSKVPVLPPGSISFRDSHQGSTIARQSQILAISWPRPMAIAIPKTCLVEQPSTVVLVWAISLATRRSIRSS